MTKGELLAKYRNLLPEDQRRFDRWLTANVVVSLTFTLALVAMAINSAGLPGPGSATAKSAEMENTAAAGELPNPSNGLSAYELMIRFAPDELPVQKTSDPF